ncbi:PRC-barrel domain-containing protein [Streptomyces sp. NPDC096048]|uniref:PRC-barrel domain-containing protein n=1 Tax=Streptomyces sp. NPDC096048 TaxID=3366072 RepID=UPI0038286CD5
MESGDIHVLTKLSDSDHAIPSADDDIRGREVTDRSGNELGKVGDLIIDQDSVRSAGARRVPGRREGEELHPRRRRGRRERGPGPHRPHSGPGGRRT